MVTKSTVIIWSVWGIHIRVPLYMGYSYVGIPLYSSPRSHCSSMCLYCSIYWNGIVKGLLLPPLSFPLLIIRFASCKGMRRASFRGITRSEPTRPTSRARRPPSAARRPLHPAGSLRGGSRSRSSGVWGAARLQRGSEGVCKFNRHRIKMSQLRQ